MQGERNFPDSVFVCARQKGLYGGEESSAGMRSISSSHPWPCKGGHRLHLHSVALQKQEAHISRVHILVNIMACLCFVQNLKLEKKRFYLYFRFKGAIYIFILLDFRKN